MREDQKNPKERSQCLTVSCWITYWDFTNERVNGGFLYHRHTLKSSDVNCQALTMLARNRTSYSQVLDARGKLYCPCCKDISEEWQLFPSSGKSLLDQGLVVRRFAHRISFYM